MEAPAPSRHARLSAGRLNLSRHIINPPALARLRQSRGLARVSTANYGLSDFDLDGTVTNNSTFPLGVIYFEVTITECQNGTCRVVGQSNTSASVTVPAGQVRAFSLSSLRFENLPAIIGARSWTYKITGLRTA